MNRVWLIVPCLAAAAAFATPAAAKIPSAGNPCPAPGSTFTVNAGNAGLVADGFDCKDVDLVVTASITPTISTLLLTAHTIVISAGVQIINTVSSDSSVFLTAEGGGINITSADVRANDHLIIECKPSSCVVNILGSVIRAPVDPNSPLTSGDTRAIGNGDVLIEDSTFFGTSKVVVSSSAGKVVWHCGGGVDGCQDPLTSGVLASLTDQPSGQSCAVRFAASQPCLVNFANALAVHDVCFPIPPPAACGGGQCHVTAQLDVDLVGSTITCQSHFPVTSKTGSILLKDARIRAGDALSFQAQNSIDATDALLTSKKSVTLETKGGTPGVCITATNTDFDEPPDFQPVVAVSPGGGCTCTGPTTPPNAVCP